jgi:hypothetical protein
MRQSTEQNRRVLGFTTYRLAAFIGLILALFMYASPAPAAGQSNSDFNHQSTGFPLTGAHEQAQCQTCHVRGIFKGTPKQCDQCHTQGSQRASTAKPANHVQTANLCSQCHTSTVTWSGVRFSHAEVKPGTCATCHGISATGKPANHVQTTLSCDTCHRTAAWIPASGGALPSGHRPIIAGAACSTCHVGGASTFTHPSVASGCASCHNGINARAKKSDAIHNFAGTNACETCHKSTVSFTGALFSHASVTPGSCANCHNGSNPPAVGKPTTGHVVTAAACDTCHRTSAWIPATSGGALPSGHRPIVAGTACSTCHVGGASTFTHPSVATGCASCHNGIYARAKKSDAIHNFAGTNACETCHKSTASFTGALFSHTYVTPGSCANCHSKPATGHVTTTAACDTCHRTTAWIPSFFNHSGSGIAGNCISCHNGTTATGKNAKPNHILTSLQCDVCHRTTSWLPATFNHANVQTAGVCSTCHNGSSARGKTNTVIHAQTTAQCDGCHRSTVDWKQAPLNHTLVTTINNCGTCHNGLNPPAVGKPATGHFATQRQCDQCHTSTATWTTVRHTHTSPAYYTHSSSATCRTCHTGNNEVIAYKFAAYTPACAACHGGDFKAGSHKKTASPATINYTVAELKNCAGSCHEYTNNTFTIIKTTRNSKHKATDGGF